MDSPWRSAPCRTGGERGPAPIVLAALAASAALACAAVAGCGSDPAPPAGSSAILITLDTTIPEALSCYGVARGTTPHLDALAAEGVLYENARTVTPITAPAHASMLTGLYPIRHSVRMNGSMSLPDGVVTVAEQAQEAGLETGAIVAAVVLLRDFGLDQGFATYDDAAERGGADRTADAVTDLAIDWLRRRDPERRFLLWVHYFDPHQPHRAPPEFLARVGDNPYLAEVAFMDHHVGRLLDFARGEGLLEETLVVAVADHGEGLGRHGEATHAAFAYDTTLSVPLIVRHPDGWGAGTRSQDLVSVVDVGPTLAEGLGLRPAADADGSSLLRRSPPAGRGVYFETYFGHLSFGWSQISGWADAEGKYLFSSAPELYDVERDPGERANLLPGAEARLERYQRGIRTIAARDRHAPAGLGGDHAELQDQIEMLGYAGVSSEAFDLPEPLEALDRPSPHACADVHRDYLEARARMKDGELDEAELLLRGAAERDPTNHELLYKLGVVLHRLGRHADAIPVLERAARLRPTEWVTPLLQIAQCEAERGAPERAIEVYLRAFAHGSGPEEHRRELVRLLREAGREAEAARFALPER